MATDFYLDALDRYRNSRAKILGCSPEDFDRHSLVIVPKPDLPSNKFTLMALTLGTGTVVSVEAPYLEWALANAPTDKHYRAMFPNVLLQPLTEEAARRGETINWRSPNLSFLPSRVPEALPVPPGLRGMQFDADWRARVYATGEFHNALGELDEPSDQEDFKLGFALMDGDTIAAVAGGWDDTEGLTEIGVDVGRDYRGRGLAPVVVSNFAKIIADRGEVPTYYCAPTNVRSHRNAIACGFTPTASACRASRPAPQP